MKVFTYLFLVLSSTFCLASCSPEKKTTETLIYRLNDEELLNLSEGDFVFRLGYGLISAFLERNSGSNGVSHCGVLVGEYPDFSVIHSISGTLAENDGMQICTLDEFLDEARVNSLKVVRFKSGNGAQIAKEAYRYLDERRPFDLKFDIQDTSKIFCSELIYRILLDTDDYAIFESDNVDYYFDVFFDESVFSLLLNHSDRKEDD